MGVQVPPPAKQKFLTHFQLSNISSNPEGIEQFPELEGLRPIGSNHSRQAYLDGMRRREPCLGAKQTQKKIAAKEG
ncbi:hypothetical protein CH359_01985 [Leptospira meyeri]|nr:hypothetical protein CH359_01985 [Leptospira meyeri]PJZ98020.1 hypothetical protein CH358_03385 [Leptospira meyeri]PKA11861.1 hypothetical protein CH372_12005 [Leptospira meyeri]